MERMNNCKYFKKHVFILFLSCLLINCENKINTSNNDCRYLYFGIKNTNLNKDSIRKYYFFNSNLFIKNSRVFRINNWGEIVLDSLKLNKSNKSQILPPILNFNNNSYYQHYSNTSEKIIRFDSVVFMSQENKIHFSIINNGQFINIIDCNDSITIKTNYNEILKDVSFFIKLFEHNQVCNESKFDYFWTSNNKRFTVKVYNNNSYKLFSNEENDIQHISLIMFDAFVSEVKDSNKTI